MNEWINDELLSAYLDGEVTAEEQAKIEELLAAQPQARQLLEELRALSGALQSLPPARLETDLSERVIRAAQRQILTGGDAATESTGPAGSLWGRLRKRLTGRALFWPAVASALALWIVLTDLGRVRDAPHHREVVNAPAPSALKDGPADGDSAIGGMGSNRVAADFGVEAASVATGDGAATAGEGSSGAADAGLAPPKPAMIDPIAAGDDGTHHKLKENERWDVASAAAAPLNGDAANEPMAEAASGAAEHVGERRFNARRTAERPGQAGVRSSPPGAAAMAAASRPTADAAAVDDDQALTLRGGGSGRHSGIAAVEPAMETRADDLAAEEGILVVHVDIAADAARNDLFGRLLAQNSILWEPDPAAVGGSGWYSVNPQGRAADADNAVPSADALAARDKAFAPHVDRKGEAIGGAVRKSEEISKSPGEPAQPDEQGSAADRARTIEPESRSESGYGQVAGKREAEGDSSSMPGRPDDFRFPSAPSAVGRANVPKGRGVEAGVEPIDPALPGLKAPPSPEIELVYVEAQASQIQSLIADLTESHQSVVSVAVEPARSSQGLADRQRVQAASQLVEGKSAPATAPSPPSLAYSTQGAKGQADKTPWPPEDPAATGLPKVSSLRPLQALPGSDGHPAEAGPASGPMGGESGVTTAEKELVKREADLADREGRGASLRTDRPRQYNFAPGELPAGPAAAGGQVLLGRAHRVARLDTQSPAVGQATKDESAEMRRSVGQAGEEPIASKLSPSLPVGDGNLRRDGLRQAGSQRGAGQPPIAFSDSAVDGVEVSEKAKRPDGDFGRDSSGIQPGGQAALPQAARQQRVLFVLRTVPAVQAAAAPPQGFAPAANPADASAMPEGTHSAPLGEVNRGLTPDAPPPEPSP